jgi:hypothetical protein
LNWDFEMRVYMKSVMISVRAENLLIEQKYEEGNIGEE